MTPVPRIAGRGEQETGTDSVSSAIDSASAVGRPRLEMPLELPRRKRRREATSIPDARVTRAKACGGTTTTIAEDSPRRSSGYVVVVKLRVDTDAGL